MSTKQIKALSSTLSHTPRVTKQIVYTIPVVLEQMNGKFLHHKAHVGLSKKARCRKPRHRIGVLSRMSNPKEMRNQMNSIYSQMPFVNLHPSLMNSDLVGLSRGQIRSVSSSGDQYVTDEADFDFLLHQREFEMHRHERSPITRIVNYGQNALSKVDGSKKLLDIASSPIDPILSIAKKASAATLFAISPDRDMLKVTSDKLVEEQLPNVSTELNDLVDLNEFEDGSFDLVVSCYGLEVST